MSNIKKAAIEFYLDWFNNFFNTESMADHYNMTTQQCLDLINMGREFHVLNHRRDDKYLEAVKNSDSTL